MNKDTETKFSIYNVTDIWQPSSKNYKKCDIERSFSHTTRSVAFRISNYAVYIGAHFRYFGKIKFPESVA